jgi:transcriptional regulator with XRE-family HTH domain
MIAWVYGSGFPKSLDVSKAIDKRGGAQVAWFGPWFRQWREQHGITQKQVAALFLSKTGGLTGCVANWELGFNMPTPEQFNLIRDTFGLPFASVEEAEREVVGQGSSGISTRKDLRNEKGTVWGTDSSTFDITAPTTPEAKQWQGWGTALKPALEPITVARKPLIGTVAENVLHYGTGAINVNGGRVGTEQTITVRNGNSGAHGRYGKDERVFERINPQGRWPANFIHDGSEEATDLLKDSARFFYCAKASKKDRDAGLEGLHSKQMDESRKKGNPGGDNPRNRGVQERTNFHPTVKPTDLMRYLCRLVTPPNGIVLDPFNGSGSTGCAAVLEGFQYIGIEREAEYIAISEKRIQNALERKNQVPPKLF